jgi:hypothetical protein
MTNDEGYRRLLSRAFSAMRLFSIPSAVLLLELGTDHLALARLLHRVGGCAQRRLTRGVDGEAFYQTTHLLMPQEPSFSPTKAW